MTRLSSCVDTPSIMVHERTTMAVRARSEHEAFERLKAELECTFGAPEESCRKLSVANVM